MIQEFIVLRAENYNPACICVHMFVYVCMIITKLADQITQQSANTAAPERCYSDEYI